MARGRAVAVLVSGTIWLVNLVPIQAKQSRLAREFRTTNTVPEQYRMLSRRWLVWGILATVPLVVATWLMIVK